MQGGKERTRPILEVCVETIAGLTAAVEGGADRIELCSALGLGGLTPGPGLMAAASRSPVPVRAMVRPRGGGFAFTRPEAEAMLADVDAARAAGLEGVVLGALRPDGAFDAETLGRLRERAGPMGATLHRAIDVARDPLAGMREAARLGFDTVLTSGGATRAIEGRAAIAALARAAPGAPPPVVMAGGGVAPRDVLALLAAGARALHASCSVEAEPGDDEAGDDAPGDDEPGDDEADGDEAGRQAASAAHRLGFAALRRTSVSRVRALRAAIDAATR